MSSSGIVMSGVVNQLSRGLTALRTPDTGIVLLSARPPVLHIWDSRLRARRTQVILRTLRSLHIEILVSLSWAVDSDGLVRRRKRIADLHRESCPRHRITYLCADDEQRERFAAAGLPAVTCNHNAFADEAIFDISGGRKTFDAIYDARMRAMKRHELAQGIPRLAFITYGGKTPEDRRYMQSTKRAVPQARWLNDPSASDYRLLKPPEVARALNRAHIGLALSAREGAMFASVQYLLCGLPVVTTPSQGGRTAFFDERYVTTVAADRSAVAKAVRAWMHAPVDPQFVRQKTLARIQAHLSEAPRANSPMESRVLARASLWHARVARARACSPI